MPPGEGTSARTSSGTADADGRRRRLFVESGLKPDDASDFEVPLEQAPGELGLLFHNMERPVLYAIPQGNRASHPDALALGGGDLVADALARDLPLELREGQQHVQRQPPHAVRRIEGQSRLRETGRGDKWIFCLTAARMAAIQERK